MKNPGMLAALGVLVAAGVLVLALRQGNGDRLALPAEPQSRHPGEAPAELTRPDERTPAPARCRIRGRCLAAETQRPLSCLVRWEEVARPAKGGAVLADDTGRFTIALDCEARLLLLVEAEGRLSLTGAAVVRPDEPVDLGDLRLRRGTLVRGLVVTQETAPVGGARVRLWGQPPAAPQGGLVERFLPLATSGMDGRFELGTLVPAGTWRVDLDAGPPLESPIVVDLLPGERERQVEIIGVSITADDLIAGRVVDAAGGPVRGAAVQAVLPSGRVGDASLTEADGSFRVFRPFDGPRELSVALQVTVVERSLQETTAERFAWGTADAQVRLTAPAPFCVRVRDPSGAAVEAFSLQCIPMQGLQTASDVRRKCSGTHPGGEVQVASVRAGPTLLVVHPAAEDLLPSLPLLVDVPRGQRAPVEVVVQRPETFEVRVIGSGDAPLAAATVELLAPVGQRAADQRVPRTALRQLFAETMTRGPFDACLATAQTDAKGVASLTWHAASGLVLVARASGHLAARLEPVALVPGQPLTVRLQAGADLRVRLWPPALLTWVQDGELALHEVGGEGRRLPDEPRQRWRLADDGTCDITGVPAGTWRLCLLRRLARGDAFVPLDPPLATVVLRVGESRELPVDITGRVEPADVEGTLLVNGAPWALGRVELVSGVSGGDPGREEDRTGSLLGQTDALGRFRFAGLQPRSYALRVWLPTGSFEAPFDVSPWRVLRAGQPWRDLVELQTTRARLRLLAAQGPVPAAGHRLELASARGFWCTATTDGHGEVWFEHLPAGTFSAHARPRGWDVVKHSVPRQEWAKHRLLLGEITLPGNAREASFELRLPR